MLKYLFYIIIGIILYILINSIEKFNIGGLRAIFEYDPNTQIWDETIYATPSDERLVEGTQYQRVEGYNVDLVPSPEDNTVFYTGDTNDESGTNMDTIYVQLGRLITEHNTREEERVERDGGEPRLIPLRNSPVIGTCFTEALPAYRYGYEPDTADDAEEGIPPECWGNLGYYLELQPDTPELLIAKLVETSSLFDRPNSLCSAIVSAEQRLAFAQRTNTLLSNDLMEMVGRMVGRQVQSDLSNTNIRDLLPPILTRMYLEWQTRFTRDMMDQYNRDIENAFTELEQGSNAELRELTDELNLQVDYNSINIVILRQEVESMLFSIRLIDIYRNLVEYVFAFQLIIKDILSNFNLGEIINELIINNIKYFTTQGIKGDVGGTRTGRYNFLENIVVTALAYLFCFLMKMSNIISADLQLDRINNLQEMTTEFFSDFSLIFRVGLNNTPQLTSMLIEIKINTRESISTFNLGIILYIASLLRSKDLLNKTNLLSMLISLDIDNHDLENDLNLQEFLQNLGFSPNDALDVTNAYHPELFYEFLGEINFDDIKLSLLEIIQILFDVTG
jgi:hypothetical protein